MELSVNFAFQICHENINTPLDAAYLADFGIDIRADLMRALAQGKVCKLEVVLSSSKLDNEWTNFVFFSIVDIRCHVFPLSV